FEQVKDVLEVNKQERHIRGGLATREKYRELAKQKGVPSASFAGH
ncbi:MAG: sporulation transcriptional regulator SpoIIID, partial [Ruminococcus sp.]|nr:sporulation transcriptional regulator SpoIIID [Ruminococcus sp.]